MKVLLRAAGGQKGQLEMTTEQHSQSFMGPLPSLEIIAKNEPFHAGRHAHSCPVTYTVPLFLSSVSPVGLSEKPSSFE